MSESKTDWTTFAVAIANQGSASRATPMTLEHLESLAECALGPTRKRTPLDGSPPVEDRLYHLEHVASYDVPLLVREIVRLRDEIAGPGTSEPAPPDSVWDLQPWRYDGQMNAEHFSGEIGFSNNGTGVQVTFRAGGKVFSAWVDARALRKLLAPDESRNTDWAKHGDWIKLSGNGYAPDGTLRLLEPDCHLHWQDNYPDLFRPTKPSAVTEATSPPTRRAEQSDA